MDTPSNAPQGASTERFALILRRISFPKGMIGIDAPSVYQETATDRLAGIRPMRFIIGTICGGFLVVNFEWDSNLGEANGVDYKVIECLTDCPLRLAPPRAIVDALQEFVTMMVERQDFEKAAAFRDEKRTLERSLG